MSEGTGIEWAGSTWNTIIGCTHASEGCRHCYAEGQVHRFGGRYDRTTTIKLGRKADALTRLPVDASGKTLGKGAQWTGAVWLLPDVLELPFRRRKPTTYFVNSLADWAHESIVESEQGRRFLAAMFGVMAACPQHTFQLLTKRPEQARKWFARIAAGSENFSGATLSDRIWSMLGVRASELLGERWGALIRSAKKQHRGIQSAWPLPNVWMGCSVEGRSTKTRIDELRTLPAGLRFLSIEPLLEDVGEIDLRGISWVIVGGESGPKARPCDVAWIRSVVEQCKASGIPAFVKQLGAKPYQHTDDRLPARYGRTLVGPDERVEFRYMLEDSKGGDMSEWPEDLRVREFPR